jgi:hypothetical protein
MQSVLARKEFLTVVQRFTAVQAVGPSAVRGQPKDTLKAIQKYLGRLRLEPLADMDCRGYARWLDMHTMQLQTRRREMAWGIARKAINLFMRSCLYNTYLSKKFHLARVQRYMEIPLDSAVVHGLKKKAGRGKLPQWPRLIRLKSGASQQFQDYAKEHAQHVGLPGRVFLDNYLWLENR